jgi:hypothetical protein
MRVDGLDMKRFGDQWGARGAAVNANSPKSLVRRADGGIGCASIPTANTDTCKVAKLAYGTTASKASAPAAVATSARASSSGRQKQWVQKAGAVSTQVAPAAPATITTPRTVSTKVGPATAKAHTKGTGRGARTARWAPRASHCCQRPPDELANLEVRSEREEEGLPLPHRPLAGRWRLPRHVRCQAALPNARVACLP